MKQHFKTKVLDGKASRFSDKTNDKFFIYMTSFHVNETINRGYFKS